MDTQALYAAAEQVRDEHADNANTANRVGSLFYAIVEAVADVSSSVSALSLRVSALENGSGGSSSGDGSKGGMPDTGDRSLPAAALAVIAGTGALAIAGGAILYRRRR